MYKSNLYHYNQSSEEDDSSNEQYIAPAFVKSAVFDNKQQPLIKSNNYKYESNNLQQNDVEQEDESHLRPKLKIEPQQQKTQNKNSKFMQNVSSLTSVTAKNHSVSEVNLNKKAVNAAYTFKLKSPNPARKKNDPVSLFQQTTNRWKKDKFLTSRTDFKQGRKLQLDKRTKQYI